MNAINIKRVLAWLSPILLLMTIGATLLLLGACQKETSGQLIDFIPIESLNECHIDIVDGEHTDNYLIINSQAQLNQFIIINSEDQGACIQLSQQLNVDFSKYTILIGKKRLPAIQGELLEQSVLNIGKGLIYKVAIKNGGYTAIGQYRFGVIIPKISSRTNVKFDVNVVSSITGLY